MNQEGNTARSAAMFGDYEIIETVGQGGMGVVYRAMDTSLGREVALKVLKDDLRIQSAIVARFQREAEACASLNHPNIVHVYSVGTVGKIPYIAMEMLHGTPLSQLMKRERRIDWKRSLQIGVQVAGALGRAHESHIIHRDIKPGNVIVDKKDVAHVTDFGIAKVLTAETQLTVEGSRLGTPQYMAPERCTNADVTASSDLYSLGVLLFQMITGRLPYEAKDPIELIRKIVKDPPSRITDFMPDIPDDVERLIAYLIEKKVEDRPLSAGEWIHLCERVLEGKPLVEDNSGLEESLKQFREAMPTPTPIAAGSKSNRAGKSTKIKRPAIVERWNKLSLNTRTVLLGVAVVLVSGALGIAIGKAGAPDTVIELARSLSVPDVDWESGNSIVQFFNETPGVTLISLGNVQWQATSAGWLNDSTAVVHLSGNEISPWQGHQGLMTLDIGRKSAALTLGPMIDHTIRVLGSHDEKAYVEIMSPDYPAGLWYTLNSISENDGLPARESIYSLLGKSANDTFSKVSKIIWNNSMVTVLAHDSTSVQQDIYRFESGRTVDAPLVVGTGDSIEHLRVSGDGRWIAYSQSDGGDSYMLQIIDTENPTSSTLHVLPNLPTPETFEFHPTNPIVATVQRTAAGVDQVVTVDLAGAFISDPLAPGIDVVWHPAGEAVIVLRPDRKGAAQAWHVPMNGQQRPKQITFLEDGVSELGEISPDGKYLIATGASDTRPALIQIDLIEFE